MLLYVNIFVISSIYDIHLIYFNINIVNS